MNPDLINGFFEMFSGILCLLNVFKILKDKEAKGISLIPLAFFILWGYWNIYFYPEYGLIWSFIGGLIIATTNTIWLILIIYYNFKNKKP